MALAAASLIGPLLDFVVSAHQYGVFLDGAAAVTVPLALMAATGVVACALAGAAAWLVAGYRGGCRPSAVLAAIVASASPLWAHGLGWPTPSWAATSIKSTLFWTVEWALLFILLYAALESSRTRRRWLPPLLGVSALVLACVFAVQLFGRGIPAQMRLLIAGLLVAGAFGLLAPRLRDWVLTASVVALGALTLAAPLLPLDRLSLQSAPIIPGQTVDGPRHLILITIDTLRRDALGVYSDRDSSPRIDAFAENAVVFDRAYSTASWTAPAMTSIMTGVTPLVHGVRRMGDFLPASIPTLAERLAEQGRRTAAFGNNYFLTAKGSGGAMRRGFDFRAFGPRLPKPLTFALEWVRAEAPTLLHENLGTDEIARAGSQWVSRNRAEPFFLWLHFYDPHGAYSPPGRFYPAQTPEPRIGADFSEDDLADVRAGRLPMSKDRIAWIRRLYQAEVSYVDDRVGSVFDELERLGIFDDALIVLTSDHGEEFFEHGGMDHGHTSFEELLRVPLIVKLPGRTQSGRRDELVSTASITPTLLTLAGIPSEPDEFSVDALPGLSGDATTSAVALTAVYAAGIAYGNAEETVRFDRYKYVYDADLDAEQLFDLQGDPDEARDVSVEAPGQLELARALRGAHRAESGRLRTRYGVEGAETRRFDDADRRLLRSLGYIQ